MDAERNAALGVMETHLNTHGWLLELLFIGDMALYGYNPSRIEGGFDLLRYHAVRVWLNHVAPQPDYVSLSANW